MITDRLRGCLHASNLRVLSFVIAMSHDETPAPCVILNINRCVNACVPVDQLRFAGSVLCT